MEPGSRHPERHAISDTGRELIDRLKAFLAHLQGVRKGLKNAEEAYNSAVGSLETRVLTSARRLAALNPDDAGVLESPPALDGAMRSLGGDEEDPS